MADERQDAGPREPIMLIASKVADQRVVAARHAQITPVATRLFIERGFHKTTTRDIASALGWNMGTLYLYISSKEDMLYLVYDNMMRTSKNTLFDAPQPSDPSEALCAAMERYFRIVEARRGDYNFMYRESASLRVEHRKEIMKREIQERDYFAAIISRGIAAGDFRAVQPELMAHEVLMLAHMWSLKGWSLRRYVTLDEYLQLQVEMVFVRLGRRRPPPRPLAMPADAPERAGSDRADAGP